MNNDNIPGRQEYLGMSGWTLLPLPAKRKVTYAILVLSGGGDRGGAGVLGTLDLNSEPGRTLRLTT